MAELRSLKTADIRANPNNPRLDFPQEELDQLAESIATVGVLVPVVVSPDSSGGWQLIDGERRWLVAQTLGLETIPAMIVDETSETDNLVQMFNIHMVRVPWADMPTAWALEHLLEARGPLTNSEIADVTGLSTERIKRLRHALDLPKEYQNYIHEGIIPLNFFWELKAHVIEPLSKQRPTLFEEFAEGEILDSLVRKRLDGVITNVVELRQVRPIIAMAAGEVSELIRPSILDDTLRDLVRDPEMTIQDAYEETVAIFVESDKLAKKADNLLRAFRRLLDNAQNPQETEYVLGVARSLQDSLGELCQFDTDGI